MAEQLLPDLGGVGFQLTFSCASKLDPQHGKCDNPHCACACHGRGRPNAKARKKKPKSPSPLAGAEPVPERVLLG